MVATPLSPITAAGIGIASAAVAAYVLLLRRRQHPDDMSAQEVIAYLKEAKAQLPTPECEIGNAKWSRAFADH